MHFFRFGSGVWVALAPYLWTVFLRINGRRLTRLKSFPCIHEVLRIFFFCYYFPHVRFLGDGLRGVSLFAVVAQVLRFCEVGAIGGPTMCNESYLLAVV